jgi:pSer/pThr/pTyr-binding forkhead associated (FHA) protein
MVAPGNEAQHATNDGVASVGYATYGSLRQDDSRQGAGGGMPVLTLANDSLNIRIVAMNGAIIGRRKGPYTQFFEKQAYVSGVHAQLMYNPGTGWCVVDKHSSNGTKLNQRQIQPDVNMTLNNGDILTIANVNLQVIIR